MCQPRSLSLPPTATHSERRCHWMPEPNAGPLGVLGTATICCGKNTADFESYLVEEVDPNGADGRAWLFHKLSEDRYYVVIVGRNPSESSCTCKGFYFGRGADCRHLSIAKELLAAGDLDPMAGAPRSEEHPHPSQVGADAADDLPDCFREYPKGYPGVPF